MGIDREREILSVAPLSGTTPFSFQTAMPRENLPLLHRAFAYRSIDRDIGREGDQFSYMQIKIITYMFGI